MTGPLPVLNSSVLKTVDLSENYLFGRLPSNWLTPSLEYIDISYNQIEGYVPGYFGELRSLKYFSVSHNKLSGRILIPFWTLPSLSSVDLSYNLFSGDIGVFIVPYGNFTFSYDTLDVSNNYLTGELNWRIYTLLTKIRYISFRNNKISRLGELNISLRWRHFDVSKNPIEGRIPETFNKFSKLQYLGLIGTKMNHNSGNYLPSFVHYTEPFNLRSKNDNFVCPTTNSKRSLFVMVVDIDPAYYDYALCQCLPNYFGFGMNCRKCPPGCECIDGVSLKNCHASPNVIGVKDILYCPRHESCHTKIPEKQANTSNPPAIEKLCEKGYEGRACSKCENGYGRQGYTCEKCEDGAVYSTIVLGTLGLCCLVLYLYHSENPSSAKLRIIMFHMQTISVISSGIIVPRATSNLVDLSFSVGSIQPPNLACVLGSTDQMEALVFSFLRIPVFLIIGLIAYHSGSGRFQTKAVFITINMLFFIYYSIAREVFGVFGCTVYDQGEDSWYLHNSPWIECQPASAEYRKLIGMSIPVFLFFLIGYPVFIWKKIEEMQNKPGYDPIARYGFLYLPYKESYRHWEFVIIIRRLAYSFVMGIIPYTQQPIFYLLLVIVIQSSIWMQNEHRPYNSKLENQMEITSLYVIFISFALSLLVSFLGPHTWATTLLIAINLIWWVTAVLVGFILPLIKKGNPLKIVWKELKQLSTSDPWFNK